MNLLGLWVRMAKAALVPGHSQGPGRLRLQAGLQCCSDAGCAVPGGCGTHLLSEHTPGGHPTLSAHSWTPPHPLGPAAPATQPQAAGRGILGKNLGSPPSHSALLNHSQATPYYLGHYRYVSLLFGPSGTTRTPVPREKNHPLLPLSALHPTQT